MDNCPSWKKYHIEEYRTRILIKSLCFDFEEPWIFELNGETISAEIKDRDFTYVVKHGGISFESGCALDADIRAIEKDGKTEYLVLKVHDVLIPPYI